MAKYSYQRGGGILHLQTSPNKVVVRSIPGVLFVYCLFHVLLTSLVQLVALIFRVKYPITAYQQNAFALLISMQLLKSVGQVVITL